MSVTAIVVNYNAGDALKRCIQSLLDSTLSPRIRVVDNASTDKSAENLRNLYGSYPGLEVLVNPANLGFACAVNRSVEHLTTEYVLVLNPDCRVEKDTLERLRDALRDAPDCALAAPAVRDVAGRPERASFRRFPSPWNSLMTLSGLWRLAGFFPVLKGVPVRPSEWPGETCRAEAVSGACMMIRRSALLQVGLLDENYGLHCEDLDLMYRFHQAGWHCLFVPQASAVHEQGVSSASRPLWVHFQKHRGMARFFGKFQAPAHKAPFRWLVYSGIWLRWAASLPLVWIRR